MLLISAETVSIRVSPVLGSVATTLSPTSTFSIALVELSAISTFVPGTKLLQPPPSALPEPPPPACAEERIRTPVDELRFEKRVNQR
ncbi:hypothetical protein NLX86_00040 [Streptomyces sp. A3M-1-3]|uniref:hypothetical protein n=1 Tax=Streptomyces sp. A3M-1-3 TaxID=2962044 RepID=UPI0020B7E15D|nr:hypothetical protein [Streptomyces sp. A3M-1-3]MCP3816585.1 hypothetical protein [Streptomyces sp. A3M-1-3]